MKKFGLSLALLAGLSFAVVTAMPTPAEAQKSGKSSKKSKKSKGKAAKVTVQKVYTPVSATYFNQCVGAWGWLAPVGVVGCGAFWAVPTVVESIFWRA